ncbi:MAG: Bax inhibitor-1/YccA family protein [Gammaproteobacteria bacterium]|nr:Bax inhibitor-1/YccA family protein [Gammaproteobacteria bacterium]
MAEERNYRVVTTGGNRGGDLLAGGVAIPSELATNRVLRNTYLLLAATLLFSAAMAGVAMAVGMPYLGPIVTLVGYFGLLFLTYRLRNSAAGIAAVFGLTGFMGLTLGPLLSAYMSNVPNGGDLVMTSLGVTGLLFAGLSVYVVKSRRDMSFMGSFLTVGLFGLLGVILVGLFVDLSAFQMAISSAVVLLMAGMILYETSAIIHGGQDNYILATVSLYVSIYNIFVNLLALLGMGGDD